MSTQYRNTNPAPTGNPYADYAEKAAELEAYLAHTDDPAARERLAMLKAILEEIIEQAGEGKP